MSDWTPIGPAVMSVTEAAILRAYDARPANGEPAGLLLSDADIVCPTQLPATSPWHFASPANAALLVAVTPTHVGLLCRPDGYDDWQQLRTTRRKHAGTAQSAAELSELLALYCGSDWSALAF